MEEIPTVRWLISGPTGSGKTVLLRWLLSRYPEGAISELFVFCSTTAPDGCEWPETTPTRVFTEWDPELVRHLESHPGHKWFVVDDFAYQIRPDDPALVGLYIAGRHRGSSVAYLTQRYNSAGTAVRANATTIFLTQTLAKVELDLLYEELAGVEFASKRDWYDFVKRSTDDHAVLAIDRTGKAPLFQILHPPARPADFFVEPGYSSEEGEDEAPAPPPKKPQKGLLPASNKRWTYKMPKSSKVKL